ncbi:MAG: SprT family zinc-dependent metalloprotease [Legionella sp.]|nr:SprT family zinc-dependent metalloprotease [Legionella sp.]
MKNTELKIGFLIIQIIRKPIKNMYVRIKPPDAQVIVSVPLRANLDIIKHQLDAKKEWIFAQRARFLLQPQLPASLESGDSIPFLGRTLTLNLHAGHKRSRIIMEGEELHCLLPADTSANTKFLLINTWYRRQFIALLPELIAKWEPVIGVKVANFGVKLMKTRWGSCNTRARRIWLSLNLIKKPLVCIEYVLVHELVHLLEASHNARFYALMTKFMPDWQVRQNLLEPRSKRKYNRGELIEC